MASQIVKLPVNTELPDFTIRITLDGKPYQLRMRYNTRMDRWFLDIGDAQGNPILSGVELLIYRHLLTQYPTVGAPPGDLFVTDDSGAGLQPTKQSFLTDHSLAYATVS